MIERPDGGSTRTDWTKPAVLDDIVVRFDYRDWFSSPRALFGLDRSTGDRVWTAELELPVEWRWRGHPVCGDGYVVVTASLTSPQAGDGGNDNTTDEPMSQLYVLDGETGEVVWDATLEGASFRQPAYADGYLFLGTSDRRLFAVDVANRSIAWTYRTTVGMIGRPAITPERVYVAQHRELAAIDVADGTLDWRLPFDRSGSDPVVADNAVYIRVDRRGQETDLVAIHES